MHKKLMAACMALAAFAAFAVAPSIASARPFLTQPTGTAVPTNTAITGTNVGNTVMTTSLGNVTCEKAVLSGTLKKNNTTEGTEGEITSATFENKESPECSSWTGGVTVTANPTTNGLPWCVKATATTDTITIGGGSCGTSRPIRFVLHFTNALIGTCTYQRTEAANGTLVTDGAGAGENTASITKQAWTKFEGGGGCPSSGELDMTFSLENSSGALFISS